MDDLRSDGMSSRRTCTVWSISSIVLSLDTLNRIPPLTTNSGSFMLARHATVDSNRSHKQNLYCMRYLSSPTQPATLADQHRGMQCSTCVEVAPHSYRPPPYLRHCSQYPTPNDREAFEDSRSLLQFTAGIYGLREPVAQYRSFCARPQPQLLKTTVQLRSDSYPMLQYQRPHADWTMKLVSCYG